MNRTSNRRSVSIIAAVLALSLVTPVVVFAEPTASDIATARALIVEGRKLRAEGDFKKAVEKLSAAYSLYRTPVTGHELALAYRGTGQFVEAREMALTVVKMPVEKDEGKASETARAECDTMANDLASKVAKVEIAVVGAPEGATMTVTLDGQVLPTASLSVPRFVNPGKHVAVVTIAGGAEKKVEFEVKEGESRRVDVALPAAAAKEPPPPDPTPKIVTPTPAPTPTPTPTPVDNGRMKTGWLTYTGFGVAAVGAVIGTITGIQAISTSNKLAPLCGDDGNHCPASEASQKKSLETQTTISTVSFIIAGVGLTVGIIDLVTGATATKQTSSTTMSIAVGPGSLGLVGSF
jgi:hypothetical protein